MSLHGDLSPEPGPRPHRRKVENADPVRTVQQRPNPLQSAEKDVLANALRELDEDGLVLRREYLEVPVRVEYEITAPGRALVPILDRLGDWSMGL